MSLSGFSKNLKKLKIGEELVIETEKEILCGRLQFVDVNFNFLQLCSVQDVKNNVSYTSVQLIPVNRIKSIVFENTNEHSSSSVDDSATESNTTTKSASSSHDSTNYERRLESSAISPSSANVANKTEDDISPKIALTGFELQLLQKQIGSAKLLNYRGPDYEDAIADIKAQNCIALDVEPHRSGRHRKTAIVTVATAKAVYIFDILHLGKIFEDLKTILKADRPSKAMHDSRLMADHFDRRHYLEINGISDVFVAYCIVAKQKQYLNLEDIVGKFFGISKDFFERLDEPQSIFARPLDDKVMRYCAKRVTFILKLNECLQKKMLKSYYSQCLHFSRTYVDNEDSSVVANSIETNDNSGQEYIKALNLKDQSMLD